MKTGYVRLVICLKLHISLFGQLLFHVPTECSQNNLRKIYVLNILRLYMQLQRYVPLWDVHKKKFKK